MILKLNILVYYIFTVFIISTGCKKESDNKECCRINRVTRNDTHQYDIFYGDDGKISHIELNPGNEKLIYTYDGDKLTISFTLNGNFEHRYIVTSNKNGFTTNMLMQHNVSGSIWDNYEYTYEGTRVVLGVETSSGNNDSDSTSYIWENGNPAVFILGDDIFSYEYYTDKNYQPGDWQYIQQLIGGYKLYEPKNLLKSTGTISNTTFFTYNFDDAGRITEAKSSSSYGTEIYKIEYDCN